MGLPRHKFETFQTAVRTTVSLEVRVSNFSSAGMAPILRA